MKYSFSIFLALAFLCSQGCSAQEVDSPKANSETQKEMADPRESSADSKSAVEIDFSKPGFAKEKPESGPSVAIEGGFMVPYTATIPGSEVTFEMIPIPGGEFMMGSPKGEAGHRDDEGPQVKVAVEPFWMGKHEVTWAEYKMYMSLEKIFKRFQRQNQRVVNKEKPQIDALTAPSALYDPSFTYDAGQAPDQPAATITQFAAKQYTKFLSLLIDDFYRLPTEAEWEYACRAGTTTTYYFGDDVKLLKEHAWYYENADDYRQKVGTKKPNPFGLYDMYGNVSEWVLDEYSEDGYARMKDKEVSTTLEAFLKPTKLYPRVCRGGSFELEAEDCRSAARQKSDDEERKIEDPNIPQSPWWYTDSPALGIGFRIMRPLQAPESREVKESYWSADIEEITEDAENRILENGRGSLGIVDPDLPKAIKALPRE